MINFKNGKFDTKHFVITSLAIFLLFFAAYFYLISAGTHKYSPILQSGILDDRSDDLFSLREDGFNNDPFITKRPDLYKLLRGPIISKLDPSAGINDAKINIVYFSDFECSACNKQEKELKLILEKYKDDVRVIWKDYPIGDVDSSSFQASLAARCAQDQDKFWEYHDLLFKNSENLDIELFGKLAKDVDLDLEIFADCVNNKRGLSRVRDNIKEANGLDIMGVPFVFINNQEMLGGGSMTDLERVIDVELNKSNDQKN